MIRIVTQGGIGNQLFHFALYYYLKKQGKDVCLCTSDFIRHNHWHGFELTKVFKLEINICENTSSSYYNSKIDSHFLRFYLKFKTRLRLEMLSRFDFQFFNLGKKLFEYCNHYKNLRLFLKDDIELIGSWQREEYLPEIINDLKPLLKFNQTSYESRFKNQLMMENSVLIHVRGLDYKLLGWELSREYYTLAIEKFGDIINPLFFVITNDKAFLNELNLPINYVLIDDYTGELSYINMYLFSIAKNVIISNSTFPLWGCYLNESARVVVPKTWIEDPCYSTVYFPPGWIRVNSKKTPIIR